MTSWNYIYLRLTRLKSESKSFGHTNGVSTKLDGVPVVFSTKTELIMSDFGRLMTTPTVLKDELRLNGVGLIKIRNYSSIITE